MNKKILIFALLLAFVISEEPNCKAYEAFDEESNKCVKVCEENQFANQDEGKCEDLCKKGDIFDLATSSCKSGKTNQQVKGYFDEESEDDNQDYDDQDYDDQDDDDQDYDDQDDDGQDDDDQDNNDQNDQNDQKGKNDCKGGFKENVFVDKEKRK